MASRSTGWSLDKDKRTGNYLVNFTHGGRRYHRSTRKKAKADAQREAAVIYNSVVNGQAVKRVALDDALALWLLSTEPELSASTYETYCQKCRTCLLPYFKTLDAFTTARIEDYRAERLRKVMRETVKKELNVIRKFCRWAHRRELIAKMPEIISPSKRVQGTRQKERHTVVLSRAEAEAVLANVPVVTEDNYPARALVTVFWETGLRRGTVFGLRTPTHYQRGQSHLLISKDIDKNDYARRLPISARASEALDSVCSEEGLIFRTWDYRRTIRRAAAEAGIKPHRARWLGAHDFRHSLTTDLANNTDNLAGTSYLVGHKRVDTTAHYVHAGEEAARAALDKRAAAHRLHTDLHTNSKKWRTRRDSNPRLLPPEAVKVAENHRKPNKMKAPNSDNFGQLHTSCARALAAVVVDELEAQLPRQTTWDALASYTGAPITSSQEAVAVAEKVLNEPTPAAAEETAARNG